MVKKILFFTGGSYVAGLEIVTLQLIKGLKDRGIDVRCVVNGWNDGDFKSRLAAMNVPCYEVKIGWLYLTKPSWTLDTLLNYPRAFLTCRKIMKEFKPDAVNFSSYAIPVMLYPLVKNKSFYTLHDTQLPNRKHRVIYQLLKRRIGTFIAVSNHIAETLKNLGVPAKKILVIHNGVAVPAPPGVTENQPGNSFRFAIVGQVVEPKGHRVLVDAAALLVNRGVTNFKVSIIGNNETTFGHTLAAYIKEKGLSSFFSWSGYIKDTDEIYRTADAVVVPSLCTEAFSLATVEAMIRRLPVIASNKGGMKELIDNGQNGLLFTTGSEEELSTSMLKIILDKSYADLLAQNAQKKASENYTNDAMTEKYISAYNFSGG
ncbi:MAG TPA: glycosyltransferase family 4 protein [Ferruginibacter sp.]|nr:glycosyltransferase family 4 protein [Ferruginibacter sp.]HPH93025.1 glycosyltransferase family 4 protein [Ferruginibacter sp.]